jgi:putative ABC transport system substrate-binding protein
LAVELVRRGVAVIVAPGTSGSVLAAMDATKTIPIVFRTGGDPVQLGLVASLNRPGGNVTGVNALSLETGTKRLGLLLELLPGATRFAVLFNPSGLNAEPARKELQTAAGNIGRQIEFFGASSSQQIDADLLMSCKSDRMRCWSFRKVCSSTVGFKSSCTQRATRCRRSIRTVVLPRLAG